MTGFIRKAALDESVGDRLMIHIPMPRLVIEFGMLFAEVCGECDSLLGMGTRGGLHIAIALQHLQMRRIEIQPRLPGRRLLLLLFLPLTLSDHLAGHLAQPLDRASPNLAGDLSRTGRLAALLHQNVRDAGGLHNYSSISRDRSSHQISSSAICSNAFARSLSSSSWSITTFSSGRGRNGNTCRGLSSM